MSASTKTTYESVAGRIAVDSLTKQVLGVANRVLALQKYGAEIEPMTGLQGSFRPATPYSGTTHTGCGAVDVTAYNWRNRVRVLDLLGMVACHRTPNQGNWAEHIHMALNGMGCAAASLKGQIAEIKAGGDGLAGSRPDPDRGLRSLLWPLAVFQGRTGVVTSLQHTHLYAQPAYTERWVTDVPKGTRVTALMEVNVAGDRWFVTDTGSFGFSRKWA